jgi:hypothetical protein
MATYSKPAALLPLSGHAGERMQQRSIPRQLLACVLANGDHEVHIGGGCRSIHLSPAAVQALAGSGQAQMSRRAGRVAVVVSVDDEIVTVLRPFPGVRGKRYRRQSRLRRGVWY